MAYTHKVLYQGFICEAAQYRRSIGLSPDTGWIDVDIETVKEITLFPLSFRFRSKGPTANFSGEPLLATTKLVRPTVSTRPELKNRRGRGFNEFGNLLFQSFRDGKALPPTIYRDMYVAPSGIEEITEDLACVRAHDEGLVRVPITDIRQVYPRHSPFTQRINAVLRSGRPDVTSTKDKGVFFTFLEVIRGLFGQLPGSPSVIGGDVLGLDLTAPRNLIGEGQPIVEVIQKLLDDYGLIAGFLPDGDYTINRKVSDRGTDGKVAVRQGKFEKLDDMEYEKRTQTFTQRPSVVQVIGKRRLKRITMPYIAVIRDVDGSIRRLEDVPKLWGYALSDINKQTPGDTAKNFDDVPPTDTDLGFYRRQIMREHAYKTYAPVVLFEVDSKGIGVFKDKDIETLEFMPVQDVPFYRFQTRDLARKLPTDTGVADLDEVVLIPPVVTATYLTSGLFADFASIKRRFDALDRTDLDAKVEIDLSLIRWKNKLRNIDKDVEKYRKALGNSKNFDSDALTEFRVNWRDFFGLDQDGLFRQRRQIQFLIIKRNVERRGAEISIAELEKKKKELSAKRLQWRKEFRKLKKVYDKRGAIWLRYNVPPRVVSGGYAIDRETGIIHFNKPIFQGTKPFYLDGDPEEVLTDGIVNVTWGYERNWNWIADWSNFWIAAEDKDKDPVIDVIDAVDIGGIPPFIIKAPDMRLYEEEDGTPMNIGPMRQLALDLATPLLSQPRVAVGFNQTYQGLRNVVLDGGIHQVTHDFNGDTALTHVAINAPAARGPLGPPDLKPKPKTAEHDAIATVAVNREIVEP